MDWQVELEEKLILNNKYKFKVIKPFFTKKNIEVLAICYYDQFNNENWNYEVNLSNLQQLDKGEIISVNLDSNEKLSFFQNLINQKFISIKEHVVEV